MYITLLYLCITLFMCYEKVVENACYASCYLDQKQENMLEISGCQIFMLSQS